QGHPSERIISTLLLDQTSSLPRTHIHIVVNEVEQDVEFICETEEPLDQAQIEQIRKIMDEELEDMSYEEINQKYESTEKDRNIGQDENIEQDGCSGSEERIKQEECVGLGDGMEHV
ncbi:hypothetical protein LTS03_011728, partial [Exophiala xenobiotica]